MRPLPIAPLPVALCLLALSGCTAWDVDRDDAGESEPDEPAAALAWRAERWADEHGNIPAGAWQQALQGRANLVAATAALDDGGIAPRGWVEKGPFNVAGRSRTLAIDPRDTRILWSGGVSGGLWKSTDRGATWNIVDDWWTNLSIASLTLDPGNPDVMYVGTGEGYFNDNVARGVNRSAVRGAGVFKSTDGGAHWTQLPATAAWPYVQRLAVSPANSAVVLAAVRPGGIQRSVDGGATWTQVLNVYAGDQVLFDPNDGTKAVAHTENQTLDLHTAYTSTDAGATWSPAVSGLVNVAGYDARMEFCYARSVPGVVYASCGASGGKVWRSADGGRNWVQRTTTSSTGAMWYFNGFWVDPTNENLQVVSGLHVWRSTDGGVTFSQITNGYIMTVDPHLDVHAVVADPDYDGSLVRRVYVATDGGLHVADNISIAGAGTGWRDLDNNQRSTQFYGAAGVASTGMIVGGAQDNGTLRLLGTATAATMPFGGDGGQVQIDPTNPNYVFGEYVWTQVHRSTNGGGSSSFCYGNITETTAATANFITPLVLDPITTTRLYAGATQLWRTNNNRAASVTWAAVKPSVGSKISAVAIAPTDSNLLWVGHNDGQLWRSTNGTATTPTWTAVDDNAGHDPLPNRYITRIAVDPTDSNVVWVTLGGFASGNVRVSRDGGLTFTDASGTGNRRLPDAPVDCVLLHPDATQVVYVGTEVGIFASDDAGQHWSATNDGPSNAPCEQIVFLHGSRTLLASTLGRGLWTSNVARSAVTAFGTACAGHLNPPTLNVDSLSPPRIGHTMLLQGTGLQPQATALLLLGLSNTTWSGGSLPFDLAPVGMPGCPLLVSPDASLVGIADAAGAVPFALPLPANPGLIGLPLFAQLGAQDPARNTAGFAVSAGVRAVLGQ